jgi:hypothetical protein
MPNESSAIYLLLAPEVQAELADNEIGLEDLLSGEGISVSTALADDPTSRTDGKKEPVTVIIATAALIVALTPILSKVLGALTHKQVLVTEKVLTAVEDSQGNVLKDKGGEPILQWVDRTRFVETSKAPTNRKLEIKAVGIDVRYDEQEVSS